MTRAVLVLSSREVRERGINWIRRAPANTRVEFKAEKRSLDQNSRLWAMLTDVATQKEHAGRRYTADQWKVLFMHACGREVQFIPSLNNETFIPWGQSSSDLSKGEMSELIEFIHAWGAENGVTFHDHEPSQNTTTPSGAAETLEPAAVKPPPSAAGSPGRAA